MFLEGSRHEKIIITIAAYVIGLSTGFIAFGLSTPQVELDDIYIDEPISEFIDEDSNSSTEPSVDEQLQVILNDRGLYVAQDGHRNLISANQASLLAATSALKPTNGLYYDIIGTMLSPDDNFIYFCEQLAALDTTCDPFVYDIDANLLHRVIQPDGTKAVDIETHSARWMSDGNLVSNYFTSSYPAQPWN